jgi:O-antigen ligase
VFLVLAILLLYIGIFQIKTQTKELGLSKAQTAKIENITNLLTFNLDKVDDSGRGELFDNIIYYIDKSPIVGNGIDFSVSMRAHNTYIGVWVDAGIFTFLFFIFVLVNFLYNAIRLKPIHKFFTISLITVLYIFMQALQSVINQPHLIVLFAFIGYLIDYSKMDRDPLYYSKN